MGIGLQYPVPWRRLGTQLSAEGVSLTSADTKLGWGECIIGYPTATQQTLLLCLLRREPGLASGVAACSVEADPPLIAEDRYSRCGKGSERNGRLWRITITVSLWPFRLLMRSDPSDGAAMPQLQDTLQSITFVRARGGMINITGTTGISRIPPNYRLKFRCV